MLVDMAVKLGGHVPRVLARYRAAAPRDLPVHREGRGHYGIQIDTFLPQPEAVQALVHKKGLFSFYRGRPQRVLRHPQGRAADARARASPRVGHRPAEGSEPGHPQRMFPSIQLDPTFGRPIGRSSSSTRSAPGPRSRCGRYIRDDDGALQHAARSRLRFDRLRALHAPRAPRAARTRGALVVGREHEEGVRPSPRQREVTTAPGPQCDADQSVLAPLSTAGTGRMPRSM